MVFASFDEPGFYDHWIYCGFVTPDGQRGTYYAPPGQEQAALRRLRLPRGTQLIHPEGPRTTPTHYPYSEK